MLKVLQIFDRRKRGERSESSESQNENSNEELLVKKLTQERIEELKRLVRLQKAKYRKQKQKIEQVDIYLNSKSNIYSSYK